MIIFIRYPTSNTASSTSKLIIWLNDVLFFKSLNFAGISPLFSIYILNNYLSLTNISLIESEFVDKNALGPKPSPSK